MPPIPPGLSPAIPPPSPIPPIPPDPRGGLPPGPSPGGSTGPPGPTRTPLAAEWIGFAGKGLPARGLRLL